MAVYTCALSAAALALFYALADPIGARHEAWMWLGPANDVLSVAFCGALSATAILTWTERPARSTRGAPGRLVRCQHPHHPDLRHTGATMAAQAGATLAELMNRLGHANAVAALIYQHAAAGRDEQIARRLSAMAEGHHLAQ